MKPKIKRQLIGQYRPSEIIKEHHGKFNCRIVNKDRSGEEKLVCDIEPEAWENAKSIELYRVGDWHEALVESKDGSRIMYKIRLSE